MDLKNFKQGIKKPPNYKPKTPQSRLQFQTTSNPNDRRKNPNYEQKNEEQVKKTHLRFFLRISLPL